LREKREERGYRSDGWSPIREAFDVPITVSPQPKITENIVNLLHDFKH